MNKPHVAGSIDTGWLVFDHGYPQVVVCETWQDVILTTKAMNLPLGYLVAEQAQSEALH